MQKQVLFKTVKFTSTCFVLVGVVLFTSCNDNVYPRPKGNVRLEYPDAVYENLNTTRFSFERNNFTKHNVNDKGWLNIKYPNMKATVHLTYKHINGDSKLLIDEIHKLTYKHTVKASGIIERPYANAEQKTYGTLFEVTGDAASNLQFYVTDSVDNIVSGSLYFFTAPNADSLAPAVNYIKKDVIKIMETLKWNN